MPVSYTHLDVYKRQIYGLSDKIKSSLADKDLSKAEKILEQTAKLNQKILVYDSESYPQILKNISSPPYVLYVQGKVLELDKVLTIGAVSYTHLDVYKRQDVDYYLNEEAAYELENNVIPKHQLLEKISKTIIDVSNYAWAEGIKLRTSDENKEILEIVNYGSIEAYKASLPEATDDFKIDTDYRLSKLELGI